MIPFFRRGDVTVPALGQSNFQFVLTYRCFSML